MKKTTAHNNSDTNRGDRAILKEQKKKKETAWQDNGQIIFSFSDNVANGALDTVETAFQKVETKSTLVDFDRTIFSTRK